MHGNNVFSEQVLVACRYIAEKFVFKKEYVAYRTIIKFIIKTEIAALNSKT
jgi:hypothetical protein